MHGINIMSGYRIWDNKKNSVASVAGFFSKESADAQIRAWQERQRRGGRPDVDATYLEAVSQEELERRQNDKKNPREV